MSNNPLTNNLIAKKIEEWILEEDDIWNYERINQQEIFFNIKLQSLNDRNIHIIMDDTHDRVLLTATINPTKEQRKALSVQPMDEKKWFCANLLLILYQMGINASLSDEEDKIKEIRMESLVYFDGLTKDRLFSQVFLILRGIESTQEYFNTLSTIPDDIDSLR